MTECLWRIIQLNVTSMSPIKTAEPTPCSDLDPFVTALNNKVIVTTKYQYLPAPRQWDSTPTLAVLAVTIQHNYIVRWLDLSYPITDISDIIISFDHGIRRKCLCPNMMVINNIYNNSHQIITVCIEWKIFCIHLRELKMQAL